MQMVTLPNGKEEAVVVVASTMIALQQLESNDRSTFYELVMMCREGDYKPNEQNMKQLKFMALVEGNGRPHSSIENVVCAVVKGVSMDDMHIVPLGSPE